MKGKPQVHFWTEMIERNPGSGVPNVLAINVCRAWDVPANGVFMIFTSDEMLAWDSRQRCRDLVLKKLEARERALVNYYGRTAKHHLADITLLPSERRERNAAHAPEHKFNR